MLIEYHKPLGDLWNKQDPLPSNWRELAAKTCTKLPRKFSRVDEGKLYRSGIPWPHQVRHVRSVYGIKHVVSLIDGDWLQEFYTDPNMTIHKFPINQRRELNFPKNSENCRLNR